MWFQAIHWDIQEKLGEGQQGSVFKALRRDSRSHLQQTVAIKILHSKTAVETWRKEFESLNRVRSPYCVQVLSFERIYRQPALVLEYVEGVSLQRLNQRSSLNEAAIQEILAQIQAGVTDLKNAGLFHGDLSPRNVLIDTEGRIRLLDFGWANREDRAQRITPEFAAPESLDGGGAGFEADLFSIGRLELYLSGENLSHCPSNNYLAINPKDRTPRAVEFNLEARKQLAEMTRAILENDRVGRMAQTQLNSSDQNAWPQAARSFRQKIALGLAMITLIFSAAGSSARHFSEPVVALVSSLKIQTRNWHHISVDGQAVGYAPLQMTVNSDQETVIDWVSARGQGRKRIRLPAGRTRTLTDRDFLH